MIVNVDRRAIDHNYSHERAEIKYGHDTSASPQLCVSAKLDSCLGRLGKPFIHFFLLGEQLLDARALLHGEEIKEQKGKRGSGVFSLLFRTTAGMQCCLKPKSLRDADHPIFAAERSASLRTRS